MTVNVGTADALGEGTEGADDAAWVGAGAGTDADAAGGALLGGGAGEAVHAAVSAHRIATSGRMGISLMSLTYGRRSTQSWHSTARAPVAR